MSFGGQWSGRFGGRWQGLRLSPAPLLSLDGGLGKAQRAIVQEGVAQLLARLLVENGGYLLAVEPINTVIESRTDEQGIGLVLQQLNGRAPAILIATGEKPYKGAGDIFNWYGELTVHVYFHVNSLRSRLARSSGDVVSLADVTADPGAFVAMEHAEMLLVGQRPGGTTSAIKQLVPTAERPLIQDDAIELWEQVYTCGLGRTIDPNRDLVLELKSIQTYHRLSTQTPGDDPILETITTVQP